MALRSNKTNFENQKGRMKEKINREILVKDCNDCPEDSACRGQLPDGLHPCFCTHKPGLPAYEGIPCPRNAVPVVINSDGFNPLSARVNIPIKVGGKNDDMLAKAEAGSYLIIHWIVGLIIGVLLSAVCVTMFIIKTKYFKKLWINKNDHRKKSAAARMELGTQGHLLPDRFVMNPSYETCPMNLSYANLVDISVDVFKPEEITIQSQIGQGCFGKVFKGTLKGEAVAVKIIKNEHTDEAIKEIETMAAFSHPNILRLIGIIKETDCKKGVPWIVFDYMELGDLANVLRNTKGPEGFTNSVKKLHSPNSSNVTSTDFDQATENTTLKLTQNSLLQISHQIALGMQYLSSQHFVHRDLAARNCLVSRDCTVKISDFGLSRDVYCSDYYRVGGSRLLPIRWMPIESLLYGRFTLESDVWAYGVLLWEIYTWGKQPYYGHSNEEVVQLILDGVLLSPPSDIPSVIHEIMEGCWKTEPKVRLNFDMICRKYEKKTIEDHKFSVLEETPKLDTDDYEIPKLRIGKKDEFEYMEVLRSDHTDTKDGIE